MVRTASLATSENHRGRLKEVCMARLVSPGLDLEFFLGPQPKLSRTIDMDEHLCQANMSGSCAKFLPGFHRVLKALFVHAVQLKKSG